MESRLGNCGHRPHDYSMVIKAGLQIRPVFNNLRFLTCRTLEFFLEFCHKAGNIEQLIEFLGKKIEFIEGTAFKAA